MTVLFATLAFAAVALGASRASAALCRGIVAFVDGPRPGRPRADLLVAGAALVGGALAFRHPDARSLALGALLVASVVACTYCDVARGIVPDFFTLVPLAVLGAACAVERDAWPALAALAVAAPFALVALLSRGRGMGWGDVKFAALAGGVLGIESAIVAFSVASLAAAAFAVARGRREEPIAFVPYLAGSAAVALAVAGSAA